MAKKLTLRPEVAAFAQLMERELRKNDHKGTSGWKNDTVDDLLVRIFEETEELIASFRPSGKRDGKKRNERFLFLTVHHIGIAGQQIADTNPIPTRTTVSEAVDIANFIMMVVDVLGGLKENE
jgi:hypothetical protein